ncbi:hypothetical protein [Rhodococcus oryzae]
MIPLRVNSFRSELPEQGVEHHPIECGCKLGGIGVHHAAFA